MASLSKKHSLLSVIGNLTGKHVIGSILKQTGKNRFSILVDGKIGEATLVAKDILNHKECKIPFTNGVDIKYPIQITEKLIHFVDGLSGSWSYDNTPSVTNWMPVVLSTVQEDVSNIENIVQEVKEEIPVIVKDVHEITDNTIHEVKEDVKAIDESVVHEVEEDVHAIYDSVVHEVKEDVKAIDESVVHEVKEDVKAIDESVVHEVEEDSKAIDESVVHEVEEDSKAIDDSVHESKVEDVEKAPKTSNDFEK